MAFDIGGYTLNNLYLNNLQQNNPGIITTGLVLNLDASNLGSYSGSGTTWYDLSRNGINGTLSYIPNFSGANTGSLVFDGNDDVVTFSASTFPSGITNWSINSFFKWSGNGTNTVDNIFAYGKDGSNAAVLWINTSGYGEFQFGSDVGKTTTLLTLNTNTWYNLCATYDTQQVKLYLNAVLQNSTNISTGSITITNDFGTSTGCIGGFVSQYGNVTNSPRRYGTFNGNISAVSLYNKTLTATEIQQNFDALRTRYGL